MSNFQSDLHYYPMSNPTTHLDYSHMIFYWCLTVYEYKNTLLCWRQSTETYLQGRQKSENERLTTKSSSPGSKCLTQTTKC